MAANTRVGNRLTEHIRSMPSLGPILIDVSAEDQTFNPPIRAISIGTAGDLKVDTPSSTGVVIPANALAIGVQHSVEITKVYNSGTTATEIVGWW